MTSETHVPFTQLSKLHTPFLYINRDILKKNYRDFSDLFPNGSIYYSVKANNTLSVLSILSRLGSGFDVASWEEI